MADLLIEMKRRLPDITGEEQDDLLLALLHDAAALICNYTGRDEVPYQLQSAQVRLAVALFNRLGTEGEISRAEGDIQRRFDPLPGDIRSELIPYRLVKTGGIQSV